MKRNLYIARDHKGKTIGIVLAESEAIVNAYFVGRGDPPHSVQTIDPSNEDLGGMGLVVIHKTKNIHWSNRSAHGNTAGRFEDVRVEEI